MGEWDERIVYLFSNKCKCFGMRVVKNSQLVQGLRSCRMYKRYLCGILSSRDPCYPPPVCLTFPTPPHAGVSQVRLFRSYYLKYPVKAEHFVSAFPYCLPSWFTAWIKDLASEKGKICSCCLSCTLLFSYIFRVSPFAWRCMTCFPRFSAVSIWEKATGLGFLLGWGVGL